MAIKESKTRSKQQETNQNQGQTQQVVSAWARTCQAAQLPLPAWTCHALHTHNGKCNTTSGSPTRSRTFRLSPRPMVTRTVRGCAGSGRVGARRGGKSGGKSVCEMWARRRTVALHVAGWSPSRPTYARPGGGLAPTRRSRVRQEARGGLPQRRWRARAWAWITSTN